MATINYGREKEGIKLWALLYGTDYVSFTTLSNDYMTRYFIFSDLVSDGYLDCSVGHTSAYRLTPKGMGVARES